jgi:hypothetical protein
VGFVSVVAADLWSEVADAGLAWWSAAVGVEVGDCVINIDGPGDCCRVREYIGWLAEQ